MKQATTVSIPLLPSIPVPLQWMRGSGLTTRACSGPPQLLSSPLVATIRSAQSPCCSNQSRLGPLRRVSTTSSNCSNGYGESTSAGAGGILEYDPDVFTKFIDDRLVEILSHPDNPVYQTVLLTDGTDTRPYRLLWPSPSLVFDISPGPVNSVTSREQIDIGLKVPRSCLLQHISVDFMQGEWEDEEWVEKLLSKGYRGDTLSVWAIQMRRELSEECLQGILTVASSLLMKGSIFLGIIPISLIGTSEDESAALLRRLFVGEGFTLQLYSYEELALKWSSKGSMHSPNASRNSPLGFIAQQQRLSDSQVEMGRLQIELAEEVDEEGFEDTW